MGQEKTREESKKAAAARKREKKKRKKAEKRGKADDDDDDGDGEDEVEEKENEKAVNGEATTEDEKEKSPEISLFHPRWLLHHSPLFHSPFPPPRLHRHRRRHHRRLCLAFLPSPLLLLPFPRSSSFLAFFSGFLLLELLQKNARCLVCFNLLALLRHPNYLKTLVGLLQQVLVTDCCNKSCQLRVARELGDVLYQPLHHLAVPLPERGH